jgi:hypothetical protein
MRVFGGLCGVVLGLAGCGNDSSTVTSEKETAGDVGPAPADLGPETAECRLAATPDALALGTVRIGRMGEVSVQLLNAGTQSLALASARLDGAPGFTLRLGDVDPRTEPAILADPDGDEVPGLEPGAAATLVVGYAPQVEAMVSGELRLAYTCDANQTGELRVPVSAAGVGACLSLEPEGLSIRSLLGRAANGLLTLRGCADRAVTVVSAAFEGPDADAFALLDDESPPWVLTPEAGGPAPALARSVRFQPNRPGNHAATLRLETDDPDFPSVEVSLAGLGAEAQCPIALPTPVSWTGRVGTPVPLDGAASTDPDGDITRYEWVVVARPSGSLAPVLEALEADLPNEEAADDPATPVAVFTPDVSGRFVLELRVWDDLGDPGDACAATARSEVVLESHAALDLRLEGEPGLELRVLPPGVEDFGGVGLPVQLGVQEGDTLAAVVLGTPDEPFPVATSLRVGVLNPTARPLTGRLRLSCDGMSTYPDEAALPDDPWSRTIPPTSGLEVLAFSWPDCAPTLVDAPFALP